MPQSRRLAAIMFTDIVGYTATMQRNEKEGLKRVHRFSEVMEAAAASNHGEILEFRGDGCLAVFNSAVEAMHAAKAIQENLQKEPQVPLRIGIHIGDIVFTDGNIYGDGVNLASRVESMGVPGSILFTERVIHDIKSHPEFETASLGKFQFKNVEKPMEVFALANEGFVVPPRNQLSGKLAEKKTKFRSAIFIALLALLGASGIGIWGSKEVKDTSDIKLEVSLAVLPFVNINKDSEGDMFSDGMTEDILTYLSKLKELKVISRTSIMHYKESDKKIPEIAEELGVEHIVEGSVRMYEGKARINVRLIHVEEDQQLWSENYDRDLADIFKVQSEVAQQIVQALQINLTPSENSELKTSATANPEAYQLYIKGKRAADNRRPEELERSIKLLQSSIALDSSFTNAYSHLSTVYFIQATKISETNFSEREKKFALAEQMAKKALDLDKQNVNALSVLGGIFHMNGDLEKKKEVTEKTLRLAPNDASINHAAAFYFDGIGDYEMSLQLRKKAAELDPLLYVYQYNYITLLIKNRQFEEARKQLSKVIQLFPEDQISITQLKGMIAQAEGDYETAISFFESIYLLPWLHAPLGYCYGKTGQREKALKKIEELPAIPRLTYYKDLAVIYAGLNQEDSLFHYLDLAVSQYIKTPQSLTKSEYGLMATLESVLRKEMFFDPYRKDPEFQQLLERLKSPN
ncbi:MAG: adenylate/guanylate cyclase domain-containing protein [Bacteroidia bacterium]|nr:adenylate/guanylate cyclase domain-containing protein [Bacteroidia bacterium]